MIKFTIFTIILKLINCDLIFKTQSYNYIIPSLNNGISIENNSHKYFISDPINACYNISNIIIKDFILINDQDCNLKKKINIIKNCNIKGIIIFNGKNNNLRYIYPVLNLSIYYIGLNGGLFLIKYRNSDYKLFFENNFDFYYYYSKFFLSYLIQMLIILYLIKIIKYVYYRQNNYEIINNINNKIKIKKLLNNIKIINYNKNTKTYSSKCVICLDKYNINDKIRILPCSHDYHSHCIDKWIIDNFNCPICKNELI